MRGFPDSSVGKESTCSVGDLGSIPGLGISPGEGKGYPLQHSGLENSMDCIFHGVAKSRTRLSNFHFLFHLYMTVLILGCHTSVLQIDSSWNILTKPQRCAWLRGEGGMAILGPQSRWQDTWFLTSFLLHKFYASLFRRLSFLIF